MANTHVVNHHFGHGVRFEKLGKPARVIDVNMTGEYVIDPVNVLLPEIIQKNMNGCCGADVEYNAGFALKNP